MPIGHMTGIYQSGQLRHNIPPILYAAVGAGDLLIHLDNAIDFEPMAGWNFKVDCDIGGMGCDAYGRPRWEYTPDAGDAGDHTWTIYGRYGGQTLWSLQRTLTVSAGTSTSTIKLVSIGDSNLDETLADQKRVLLASGMTVTHVGTNNDSTTDSAGTSQNADHEGYGGRTLASFMTQAPFAPAGSVDWSTWISTHSFGAGHVAILGGLGTNDMYSQATDAAAAAVAATWPANLESLIGMSASPPAGSLKQLVPGAIVLIDMPIPGASAEAFKSTGVDPWQLRRNLWRLRNTLMQYGTAAYRGRGIYLIGTHLGVPPERGFMHSMAAISDVDSPQVSRASNAVHMDEPGYWNVGTDRAAAVIALA